MISAFYLSLKRGKVKVEGVCSMWVSGGWVVCPSVYLILQMLSVAHVPKNEANQHKLENKEYPELWPFKTLHCQTQLLLLCKWALEMKVKYTPHKKTNLIQAIISTVKFNLKRWTAFCHQQKSSLKQSHVFSEPKEKTVFTLFWIMRNAKINSLQVTNNSALLHLKGSDSPGGPTCSILWL